MKTYYASFSILKTITVPDDWTEAQVEEYTRDITEHEGFADIFNDLEISEA